MDDLFTAIIGVIGIILGAIIGAFVADWLFKKRKSDKDIFWTLRMAFDRRAFKGKYSWNTELLVSDPRPFKQAINETIQAINTGVVTTRRGKVVEKGEGKTFIRNPKWRSKMDEVEKSLIRISNMSEEIFNKKSPNGLSQKIDDGRDEIIKTFNDIFSDLRIPPLPIPTEVDVYSMTLPSLDYELKKDLIK